MGVVGLLDPWLLCGVLWLVLFGVCLIHMMFGCGVLGPRCGIL